MRTLRRIYQLPDGSLTSISPAWNDRLWGFGKTPHQTEAEWYAWAVSYRIPAHYLNLGDYEMASLPQNRTHRHKWRVTAGQVQPDLTLSDPPHPKQVLLEQIDQAASVAQLKVLMAKLVRGERA